MLGIVGDSGSGKTTITRGIVRVIGEDQITAFCTDDYHRYDRKQRAERNITPLHPDCNHLASLARRCRRCWARMSRWLQSGWSGVMFRSARCLRS